MCFGRLHGIVWFYGPFLFCIAFIIIIHQKEKLKMHIEKQYFFRYNVKNWNDSLRKRGKVWNFQN